ncbi:YIP1 family protein [Archangium sp.]|uniref:YIP1 family protein n=1 Tax=Archangium sp. TaxID=1872627 RepID=UPI003899C8F1
MAFPCPRCQHPITLGATFCTSCGTSLLLEARPGSAEPTCAVHPTLRSLAICDRCGAFACSRCLREGPRGEVLCEACHSREPALPVPWDLREELGTLQAFWQTAVEVMIRPDHFSGARPDGSPGGSLFFALLCALPASVVMGLTYLGIFSLVPLMVGQPAAGSDTPSVESLFKWAGVGMFLASAVLGPLFSVATTVVMAGLDHLVLRLAGVTGGYAVTLRGNAFAQAPWLLGAIPFFGVYVAPVWAVVARVFTYRGLHRTTWGVALAGALVGPLLTCCLCGAGYFSLLAGFMNSIKT